MGNEITIYDEATLLVDGEECRGMSCMGMSISDYINKKNSHKNYKPNVSREDNSVTL